MKQDNINTSEAKNITAKNIDVQDAVRQFFIQIGEDPARDGIRETPRRFEEAVKHLLGGYDRNFEAENKLFDNLQNYKDIIVLKNIDFFSLCEHHMLPFFGYAHIGYIPGSKVLGISKLARAVDIYARRLQDQETLASQISKAIMDGGQAKGVAVLIEARHLCNAARGVEKKISLMSTCAFDGEFREKVHLQQNFMEMVRDRDKV